MDQPDKLAEIRIPAKSSQLRRARDGLRCVVREQRCFASDTIHGVVLAVDEACSNIIRHAYGNECDAEIVLEIFRERDSMIFRLTDFAAPVDAGAVRPRAGGALLPGGLGMHIIYRVMDKVEFLEHTDDAGNVLVMSKRVEKP